MLLLAASCRSTADGPDNTAGPVRADVISNQFVYSFAEDADGQIWIGTFRGLNRYNSRDFFQYFAACDSSSISDNQIRSLLVASDSTLYIGTVKGLVRYTDRDNFETVDLGGRYMLADMIEMADSSLIMRANSMLMQYRPGDCKATKLLDDMCPGAYFFMRIHRDAENRLWIVGENAIRRYDFASNSLRDSIPAGMNVRNSFYVADNELWLTGDRLRRFDTRTASFTALPRAIAEHPVLSDAAMEIVHPYGKDGLLLLTSNDGMFFYDSCADTVMSQYDSGFPINVPDFKIKTMFTDSNGNIWFGGHDQGIDVHYHYTDRFNHNKAASTAVRNKSVVSTSVDKQGNLWMATRNDGIFILRDADSEALHIGIEQLTKGKVGYDEYIKTIFVDSGGFVWITLTNGEILKCTFDSGRFGIADRYEVWGAMSIAEDANGTIWLGTGSHFVAYLPKDAGEFRPLQVFHPEFTFIPDIVPYDDRHMLVAAFNKPLSLIDIDTREVSILPISGDSFENSLRHNVFIPTDVITDKNGDLWIGTVANGMLHYDSSDSTVRAINDFNGQDISAIRYGNDSCLWVSTLNGLIRYCPDSSSFEQFYARDGIGGNQFYDRSSASDSAGNLYFGGTHGITSFAPKNVSKQIYAPLMFQNLIVHNRAVRPGSGIIDRDLKYSPVVHLDHDNNSFGISFVAVDFCKNPRVTYRYMLEGVDERWIESSSSREAYYANVPSGTYMFHVGIVGDENSYISLKVIVDGPWWTSWWAIAVYCILFAAISGILVMAAMRIRTERAAVRRARREKEREKHINDMNMRFFANISHEFRTPLTMIAGPVKQLCSDASLSEHNRHLMSIAKINVNRMLNLINQLLDFNKLDNGLLPLEVERIDIAALLRQIIEIFSLNAGNKELKFETSGIEENCFVTADADKLAKIINNLLSNALKFTPPGGTINVGLDTVHDSRCGDCIKIFVRNSGFRIPYDKLEKIFERYYQLDNCRQSGSYNCGSGIGLYYARALASLHHGRLFAVDTPDFEGAEFVLLLPADSSIYAADRHRESPSQLDAFPLAADTGAVSPTEVGNDDKSTLPLVLVVDDDIQVAEYLRTLLSANYRVVSRFDADSALSWLADNVPSLIISDVVMPGKDGYDLCRTVKHDIRFSHIPVILLTAKATVENQVEGLQAEADAYLTKPFDPSLLLSQIGSMLSNRMKAMRMINAGTTVTDVEPDIISPKDSAFLQELYGLMEKELSNSELDVNEISRLIRMSRTKFYYKVKGLTGEPPSVFFKTYKLNRAAELIREHRYTLSEISDLTGFSSLSHFSRSFKKHFGVAPTNYV
ncbi:MAG: response regulator [Muribaculaceae bacterium]|nr:response regulator [Muribaculaceae bacterium]